MEDKRKATRIPWKKEIKVIKNEEEIDILITEVSLRNAVLRFKCDVPFQVNDTIFFEIQLSRSDLSHVIKAKAVVRRSISDHEIAVEFYSLDYNSYVTLKEIIENISAKEDIIIKDLKRLFAHYSID